MAATGGKNPDLVRDILSRGQDRRISFETAAGIAAALGEDVATFLNVDVAIPNTLGKIRIKVVGEVQAGVWHERSEWPEDERFTVEVLPLDFNAERFGLRVVGYSMDKLFLPGTVLDCFQIGFGNESPEPRDGDIVVVQRRQGLLFETTCKELQIVGDEYFLKPVSTKPEFQQSWSIGKPDWEHQDDSETRIIGIVNSAITQIYRR